MPDAYVPPDASDLAAPAVSSMGDGLDDGVDVTLIRWTLSLTPLERLAVLQGFVDSVAALGANSNVGPGT